MPETPREALIERMAIAMCSIGRVEWDVQEDHRKDHFRKQAEAALEATDFGQAVERLPFVIQTPREGLLTILAELNGGMTEPPANVMQRIREHAAEGLTGREDYRTTDALADRLAEATKLLSEVREGTELAVLSGDIDQALSFPPDLEMMIERRMH
jgi:hypothetical protein